jgi:hypothetical protein
VRDGTLAAGSAGHKRSYYEHASGPAAPAPDPQRLIAAVRLNDRAVAARLVLGGVDTMPALRHALASGACQQQLTFLRTAGANVDVAWFLMAARLGSEVTVGNMLHRGVDVNASLLDGQTALHYAARDATHSRVVLRLLAARANPHAADAHGQTPLQVGASFLPQLLAGVADGAGASGGTF